MVQILKDSVRNEIAVAAEAQFARVGFKKATIGAIAEEAGVATGTIYKYFPNKKTLFQSIVTDEFVDEFYQLTRSRVAKFAEPDGMEPGQGIMGPDAVKLLQFWVRNRKKVIIILARAEGSEYESFAQEYVDDMVAQTLEQAGEQFPQIEMTRNFKFMVNLILTESVTSIVSVLEEFEDEEDINEAFESGTAFRLGGIKAFIEWTLGRAS